MNPDADLSLAGMAKLLGEFIPRLDLEAVTIVQNDWGGAQVLIATADTMRLAGLILTSCEVFDLYPPVPARVIVLAGRIPGGLRLAMTVLNTRLGRRGFPQSRFVEIADSYTLIAEDQPAQLISAIRGHFTPPAVVGDDFRRR